MFLAKVTTRVFFGRLQQAEVDVGCNFFLIFSELGLSIVVRILRYVFGVRLFSRRTGDWVFVLVHNAAVRESFPLADWREGRLRKSYIQSRLSPQMERTPVINALFHVRVLSELVFLARQLFCSSDYATVFCWRTFRPNGIHETGYTWLISPFGFRNRSEFVVLSGPS